MNLENYLSEHYGDNGAKKKQAKRKKRPKTFVKIIDEDDPFQLDDKVNVLDESNSSKQVWQEDDSSNSGFEEEAKIHAIKDKRIFHDTKKLFKSIEDEREEESKEVKDEDRKDKDRKDEGKDYEDGKTTRKRFDSDSEDEDRKANSLRRKRFDSDSEDEDDFKKDSVNSREKAIVRDKFGKIIHDYEERQKEEERIAREAEAKHKLLQQGQVQLREKERQAKLLEKAKNDPFARYSNDEEMNRNLRDKQHWEDPTRTWKKSSSSQGDKIAKSFKRSYHGYAPPNRFNILPGYRWDGVDRSNGFEQAYFDSLYLKRTQQAEAYKYNSGDM